MKKQRFLLVMAFAMLSALVIAGPSSAKMPPGSFLTKPISNSGELGDIISNDKVAAHRYSQHYGMTSEELSKYFGENLTVSTLEKTQTFTVYYMAKNGGIVPHTKVLKAGTKVLVTSAGIPVMEYRCGNPLGRMLPAIVSKVEGSKDVLPVASVKSAAKTTAQPSVQEAVNIPETIVGTDVPVAVVPAPVQEAVLGALPIELPVVLAEAVPVTATIASTSWIVPTLLGAGAIGALAINNNGRSSNVPVPEPSSIIALGMGAMTLAAQVYKRKKALKSTH